MRFSYSLNKNIFETTVGSLVNKLHLSKRRDTLFFADIFIKYIKECEDAGYGEEIGKIGQKWTSLFLKEFIPEFLKKIPPILFLNRIMKNVWLNLSFLDDLIVLKEDNRIILKTKNEHITKIIGKNSFLPGLYTGVLNVIFNSKFSLIKINQTKEESAFNEYVFFKEVGKCPEYKSKGRKLYFKINSFKSPKGFRLSDALKKGVFCIKGNKIYFRGKLLTPAENTLFHLLSNSEIPSEKIPQISFKYFKKIIKESSKKEKLILLKTLLQTMGWGIIIIIPRAKEIVIEIRKPPFGIQKEDDNWNFIIQTILGYLWLINKKYKIKDVRIGKKLLIYYSC